MSRAHVPPRSAGNTGGVLRYRPRPGTGRVVLPRDGDRGGLWLETLCQDCNQRAGTRYDRAYAAFADRLKPFVALRGFQISLRPEQVPPVNVAPGLVSRSMLFGLLAVNPRIRDEFPEFAAALLAGDEDLRLPGRLQLRMALTASAFPRLTSGFFMFTPGNAVSHTTMAEAWFRPLAFALVYTDWGLGAALVDAQGWADITDWPRYSRDRTAVDLRNIVKRLPVVDPPQISDDEPWVALLDHDNCIRLEGYIP